MWQRMRYGALLFATYCTASWYRRRRLARSFRGVQMRQIVIAANDRPNKTQFSIFFNFCMIDDSFRLHNSISYHQTIGGEAASNAEEDEHVMIHTNTNEGDIIMMNESTSNSSSTTAVDEEDQEPTYPPTKEITAADYYNPRNLTLDELEMVLYEWEEDATNIVKEYIDMRVINSLRTGISIDDDWDDEEEEEEKEKEEVVEGVDNKNETKTSSSWMNRLKNLA